METTSDAAAILLIREDRGVELGTVIFGKAKNRTSESQITAVDFTRVAVQDIKIATAVYRPLR